LLPLPPYLLLLAGIRGEELTITQVQIKPAAAHPDTGEKHSLVIIEAMEVNTENVELAG